MASSNLTVDYSLLKYLQMNVPPAYEDDIIDGVLEKEWIQCTSLDVCGEWMHCCCLSMEENGLYYI